MRVLLLLIMSCFLTLGHTRSTVFASSGTYYSDQEKYAIAQRTFGSVVHMSRAEVLLGSQTGAASVIERRIARSYRIDMVCNQRRIKGVLMVFCARHHKLQRFLRSKDKVFVMELQGFHALGAAPAFVDWGW